MFNKTKEIISDILFTIFHPSFWFMSGDYNEEWDNNVNYLIENYNFEYNNNHCAKINDVNIWISNYPYGCIDLAIFYYDGFYKGVSNIRPKRRTIYKAYKKYCM